MAQGIGLIGRIRARINEPDPQGKPRNGLPGLKHWPDDLIAALGISLIATSFGLAIAGDSNFPYVSGIISAIVAGLVLPFLGGSYVTISGPAAALAPILAGFISWLGMGNDQHGRELLILAIAFVGITQIILYKLKVARYVSAYLPPAVVEGMLAAIGCGIIIKQMPKILGVKFHSHEPLHMLFEAPRHFNHANLTTLGLGLGCVGLVIFLSFQNWNWLKKMPAPVFAVIVGTVAGTFLTLQPGERISIPDNIRDAVSVINPSHLGEVATNPLLALKFIVVILMLTTIDGVESLATVKQVDRADKFKRQSDPNRTLGAMGVSNIASSIVGGMTIIPGGIKSNAAIMLGAKTQWCNFFTALLLLLYLWIAKPVINMIPLAALAAVMVAAGWKLCGFAKWKKIAHIGREQLFVFAVTMAATLITNELLIGLGIGVVAETAMLWAITGLRPWQLFKNPVAETATEGTALHVRFNKPLVSFGLPHVEDTVGRSPDITELNLHFGPGVTVIDHASCETVVDMVENFERSGRGEAYLHDLDRLDRVSDHHASMRIRAVNAPGMLQDDIVVVPPPRGVRAKVLRLSTAFGIGVAMVGSPGLTTNGNGHSSVEQPEEEKK